MRSKWASFGWKAKTAIIVVTTLVALSALGAALDDSNSSGTSFEDTTEAVAEGEATIPRTPPPPPEPKGYVELLLAAVTPQKAARPLCSQYRAIIAKWSSVAEQRIAASTEADEDAYAAAKFAPTVNWLRARHELGYNQSLYRASRARLRAVSRSGLTKPMITKFSKDALWICKLTADSRQTESQLYSVDSLGENILYLAGNVPWHPQGFFEWTEDGNVAWQWVDNPSCDYFSCWQIRVTTKTGCSGGLYAEINIKNGNTVLDYSNDALGSLGAGETALLTFDYTGEHGGLTGNLTDISCY